MTCRKETEEGEELIGKVEVELEHWYAEINKDNHWLVQGRGRKKSEEGSRSRKIIACER